MERLTLICGVGCAGKTTLSKSYDNVIHADEQAGTLTERYASIVEKVSTMGGEVVVEGIYKHADERTELASKADYAICIWLNPPIETLKAQAKKRRVPITKHNIYFEPPTFDEGWDEIIIRGEHEQRNYRQK